MKDKTKLPSWNSEKKHPFSEIKNFYDKISLFPQEILNNIIFYGGTIIYIATGEKDVKRCFGDLDVVVPSDKLPIVRDYLAKTGDLIIQYDGKKVRDKYNIDSDDNINDFGFKGILYGIKLSVHPIHQNENNEIITKWIKIADDEVEMIANCTMLLDSNLEEIITTIDYKGKKLRVIKPEINLGWKMRRSEGHDNEDIEYMLKNKEKLNFKEEDIDYFRAKMPSYDVSTGYKITPNGVIKLGKGTYEDY